MAPTEAPQGEALPPDRYVVLDTLGEGGMAVVYLARDRELGREVALKFLRPRAEVNDQLRQRFVREAQVAAKLSHPNIVTVHDVGASGGRLYIVMERIAGGSLEKAMAGARTDLPRFLRILAKAARGVAAAHRGGIVHRDLKPGNIMLAPDDEPKVVDFGLAHLADAHTRLTRTGATIGTPAYMAPEQVSGRDVSARTDVYALGVILYEMLTGTVPHEGATPIELYQKIVAEPPRSPRAIRADIPAELEAVAMKAIEKDSADRYPSAAEFADDVERYLAGEPVVARPASTVRRLRRALARHRGVLIPVAATTVAAIAVGAWAISRTLRELARQEALRLVERGRPALDEAVQYLYSRDSDYEQLQERVKEGQRLIERALAIAPDLAVAHHLLGRAWELRGQPLEAEKSWRRAIAVDPAFSPARFSLGRSLMARAVIAGTGTSPEARTRRRSAALVLAREAQEQVRAAVEGGSGLHDELHRELARVILVHLEGRVDDARSLASEGAQRFKGRHGAEEFHVLRGMHVDAATDKIAAFDEALHIRPKNSLALFNRACALADVERRDEAIAGFTAAIAVWPGFTEAYFNRGCQQILKGDLDPGLDDLRRVVDLDPEFPEVHAVRANVHTMRGRYDLAIADCGEALRRQPDLPLAFFYRGRAYKGQGDLEAARRDFDRAIELEPDGAEARDNRAHLLVEQGALDGALADWAEVIRLRPADPSPEVNYGSVLRLKGDVEGALTHLSRAIARDAKHAEAWANRGGLLCEMGKVKEGLADLHRAVELDPAALTARANRAAAFMTLGDDASARRDLDEAIRLNAQHAGAYAMRGALRCRTGDAAGGMADLERALELSPLDVKTRMSRAVFRKDAGDAEGALADLDRCLEIDPRTARAYGIRGVLRAQRGRIDEAMADFDEGIRQDPNELDSRSNRAVLRIKRGEWAGVVEDLDVVLRLMPDRYESRYYRAGALYYLKRYAEAEADATRALASAPPDWPLRAKAESLLKLIRER